MKKLFKVIAYLLLTVIIVLAAAYFKYNDKRPVGIKGEKAEALAQKMMQAVNKSAWDTTRFVSWTSRGGNTLVWDKTNNFVQVEWKKNKVLLDAHKQTGKAWENQTEVTDPAEAQALIQSAYKIFINDAFWLNPIAKFYDEGVERSIVTLADGREGLLVSYSMGGETPGDAYLWLADANGVPTAWQMWVNILPIGGLEFSWEDWLTLPTGAKIAMQHKTKWGVAIPQANVKSAQNLVDLGVKNDLFLGL
ncbi:MAG: hypothetical protein U5L45_14345 [Saprospiraceae bacterium]|nr:hypothetical protein [Saprospiraceae bacterium]